MEKFTEINTFWVRHVHAAVSFDQIKVLRVPMQIGHAIFPREGYLQPTQFRTQKNKNSLRGSTNLPNQNLRQFGHRVHEIWSEMQQLWYRCYYYVIFTQCFSISHIYKFRYSIDFAPLNVKYIIYTWHFKI